MDLISVIIPSFNHAKFIAAAIRSVSQQSYKNWELIVVDDGSTDGTDKIANELLSVLPQHSVFIQQKNSGAHNAINRGIQNAKGKWISILNSDDEYHPERLQSLLQFCDAKAHFCFSSIQLIDEEGRTIDFHSKRWNYFRSHLDEIQKNPSVGFAFLKKNVSISTGNFFFHRDLFTKVGPFRSLRYCHDWDFALRILEWTEPKFHSAPLYNYRIHGKNSYLSLQSEAGFDGPFVTMDYLRKKTWKTTENPLCPNSINWPSYWHTHIQREGLEPYFFWRPQEHLERIKSLEKEIHS